MYEPNVEQLQAVIIQDDIQSLVAELSLAINDETLGVEIPALGLYCQKTGTLIGARNENSLFSLIKICGKSPDLLGNLYNGTSLFVHPAWLHTDGESLDALIESDPIGYACYCFGLITKQFYQTHKNQNPRLHAWAERYWALARAHALMTVKGAAGLTELNIQLCRVITFMPDTTNYLFKRIRKFAQTPDQLALLHCTGELTQILTETTQRALDSIGRADHYIKRTRFIDIAATPEDMARGPSNVRKQRSSKRSVAEASFFAEMAKEFADAGLNLQATNLPGSTAWRARVAEMNKSAEKQDEITMEEIAGLAELTNLADSLFVDEPEEDNEIEIRKLDSTGYPDIAIELQPIVTNPVSENIINEIAAGVNHELSGIEKAANFHHENQQIEPLNSHVDFIVNQQPPRKLSALELLRMKKEGK